jgi:hypothetical protein
MPLKIISDEDLQKELDNCGVVKNLPTPGRTKGDNNVPEGLRKIIGDTANTESRKDALELASEFGISNQSVSAYSVGATSLATYNEPDQDLISHINNRKILSAKRAQSKLLKALHHITEEKLANTKPVELAAVAKAMSSIVKDMEPESGAQVNGGPTFVFYAPKVFAEDRFPVITVNE